MTGEAWICKYSIYLYLKDTHNESVLSVGPNLIKKPTNDGAGRMDRCSKVHRCTPPEGTCTETKRQGRIHWGITTGENNNTYI